MPTDCYLVPENVWKMWKLQESHYDSDHIVTWKYMQLAMQTKRKYVTVLCNHFLHCLPHCICTLASVICIHGLVVLEAFPRTSMYLLRIHLLHVPFHFICSKILAESVGVFMLYPHLCICLYLFFFFGSCRVTSLNMGRLQYTGWQIS